MSTPPAGDSPQVAPGWVAYDLTPHDVAPLLDRFITHFSPGAPSDCWPWTGPRFQTTGYGKLSRSSRFERNQHLLAHRISWVAFSGQAITGQMTVDHLCNNKLCVNPDHLELVTLHENIRRKNERLGYTIGASRYRGGPRRRSPRPFSDDEDRVQRARDNALGYYRANRDEILARRRAQPRPSVRTVCGSCGTELRHDGMRRHVRRMHGGEAA